MRPHSVSVWPASGAALVEASAVAGGSLAAGSEADGIAIAVGAELWAGWPQAARSSASGSVSWRRRKRTDIDRV
jgi:hypothetical protein